MKHIQFVKASLAEMWLPGCDRSSIPLTEGLLQHAMDVLLLHPCFLPCTPCILYACGAGPSVGMGSLWGLAVMDKGLLKFFRPYAGNSHIRFLFPHKLPFSPFSISEPTRQSNFFIFIPFPHKRASQTDTSCSYLSWTDSQFPRHRGWLCDQTLGMPSSILFFHGRRKMLLFECYCILGLSASRLTGSDTASLAHNS